jgi:hypothetical protein
MDIYSLALSIVILIAVLVLENLIWVGKAKKVEVR